MSKARFRQTVKSHCARYESSRAGSSTNGIRATRRAGRTCACQSGSATRCSPERISLAIRRGPVVRGGRRVACPGSEATRAGAGEAPAACASVRWLGRSVERGSCSAGQRADARCARTHPAGSDVALLQGRTAALAAALACRRRDGQRQSRLPAPLGRAGDGARPDARARRPARLAGRQSRGCCRWRLAAVPRRGSQARARAARAWASASWACAAGRGVAGALASNHRRSQRHGARAVAVRVHAPTRAS